MSKHNVGSRTRAWQTIVGVLLVAGAGYVTFFYGAFDNGLLGRIIETYAPSQESLLPILSPEAPPF